MSTERIDTAMIDGLAISLPAPWIDHVDRDFAGDANLVLDHAVDQFNDALIACALFKPVDPPELTRGFFVERQSEDWNNRLRNIYARAYVYALDTTRAFVAVLSKDSRIEGAAKSACEAFLDRYGHIREIRNSFQHIEERSQGIGSRHKKLALVILGSLAGSRFGVTTGDGLHREVEISEQAVGQVRSDLLEIIWSFKWIDVGNSSVRRQDGVPKTE